MVLSEQPPAFYMSVRLARHWRLGNVQVPNSGDVFDKSVPDRHYSWFWAVVCCSPLNRLVFSCPRSVDRSVIVERSDDLFTYTVVADEIRCSKR